MRYIKPLVTLASAMVVLTLATPVIAPAPDTIPPQNINSQQTAYYDYQGGPQVVRIDYMPEKITKVKVNTNLYTCPHLATAASPCTYHNGRVARDNSKYLKD